MPFYLANRGRACIIYYSLDSLPNGLMGELNGWCSITVFGVLVDVEAAEVLSALTFFTIVVFWP